MSFRYGTPSCKEYWGLWKSSPKDADVTREEYDRVYLDFHRWLRVNLGERDSMSNRVPCYFIGDFTHDRTQRLEFNDYSFMTPELVRSLQELLLRPEYRSWRITLGTGRPEDMMVVYPYAICAERQLAQDEIDAGVRDISRLGLRRDTDNDALHTLRLDRIRYLLPNAYVSAMDAVRPFSIRTELEADGRKNVIRMWVVHPPGEDLLQLFEYEYAPKASLTEEYYLLPGGVVIETSRPKPMNAVFLAAYDFCGSAGGCLTMDRKGIVSKFEY